MSLHTEHRGNFRFFINKNEKEWKMPIEFHREYEIFYALEGRGLYYVSNRYYSFEEGDILLVRRDELHKCQTFNGESFKAFVILFGEEILGEDAVPELLQRRDAAFSHHRKTPPELRKRILAYFERLREENILNDEHSACVIRHLLGALLLELARLFAGVEDSTSDYIELRGGAKPKRFVMDAMSYINANFTSDLSLNEVAAQVFLSPSYLSREFKKQTGYSVMQFINTRKMSMAKSLLRDSSKQVSEIAAEIGFNNVTHFHYAFKKQFGMSPNSYRKRFWNDSYSEMLAGDEEEGLKVREYVLE